MQPTDPEVLQALRQAQKLYPETAIEKALITQILTGKAPERLSTQKNCIILNLYHLLDGTR
jgi:DNA-binding TFAR19-related protein (PDSD5 family)